MYEFFDAGFAGLPSTAISSVCPFGVFALLTWSIEPSPLAFASAATAAAAFASSSCDLKPVSYTHLDVYKRQISISPSTRPETR